MIRNITSTYSQLESVLPGSLDNDLAREGETSKGGVHLRDAGEYLARVGVDILIAGGEEQLRTGQA